MAASHIITRTEVNRAYHAHSFADFEAEVAFGGAVSGQTIGVSVEIEEKDRSTVVVANAAYVFEAPGAATVSTPIYDMAQELVALINAGLGNLGFAWATLVSSNVVRINVTATGVDGGEITKMITPVLVAPV